MNTSRWKNLPYLLHVCSFIIVAGIRLRHQAISYSSATAAEWEVFVLFGFAFSCLSFVAGLWAIAIEEPKNSQFALVLAVSTILVMLMNCL